MIIHPPAIETDSQLQKRLCRSGPAGVSSPQGSFGGVLGSRTKGTVLQLHVENLNELTW